jgi:hypothetical protein
MAKPYYFQTEDEKRMAAIRANPSGRPTQMVRPMLPNSYDAREKWRENVPGGKMIGIDQYKENNRKMYTMEDVPTLGGATGSPVSPNAPDGRPLTQVRTSNGWQAPNQQTSVDIARRYGGGAQAQNTAVYAQRGVWGSPDTTVGTGPSQGDVMDMEKAGTADMSPRFSPIEMRKSTLDAWQSGALAPQIAKADPYGTMLNDRPGRGRTYESPFLKPRPMGSGTLSQRPTSTASGAAERVAYRRAIRMNPKSSEEDRRWARGIGGARNSSYENYD